MPPPPPPPPPISLLEYQGCHCIPFPVSSHVFLPCPLALSVLLFFCKWYFLLILFFKKKKELTFFLLRERLFFMAVVEQLRDDSRCFVELAAIWHWYMP